MNGELHPFLQTFLAPEKIKLREFKTPVIPGDQGYLILYTMSSPLGARVVPAAGAAGLTAV